MMSLVKKVIKFCNKNLVAITGVGIIIGIHWLWDRLQHIPELVPEKERRELPIILGARRLKDSIVDQVSNIKHGFLPSEQKNDTKQE